MTKESALEKDPEHEFRDTACLRGAPDGAETGTRHRTVGIAELSVIPRVVEFPTELQLDPFDDHEIAL
jgi:hypothetical protein